MIEREQVRLPTERCPYCHEAVERGDPDKVACNACMAWHHAGCWNEHGACAGCGAARTGLASTALAGAAAERLPRERPPALWTLGILLLLLVPLLTFLALWAYNDNVEHVAHDVREAFLSASVVVGGLAGGICMLVALVRRRRLNGAPRADDRPRSAPKDDAKGA